MKRIEIIAVGKEKIYSIGTICVSKKGDVYHVYKMYGSDLHSSRHADGKLHWQSKKPKLFQKIREGLPIEKFTGIEYLETTGLNLNSLPEVYREYKMKKCNGIFAIDIREFKNTSVNIVIAILTKEGLPLLYALKHFGKHQIYLYTDSYPMIAITAFEGNVL